MSNGPAMQAIGDVAANLVGHVSGAPEPPLREAFPRDRLENERRAFTRFNVHKDRLGLSDPMAQSCLERAQARLAILYGYAESPIERAIAPWLLSEWYGPDLWDIPAAVHPWREPEGLPSHSVVVIPQMAFVRYRLDFAIVARVNGRRLIVNLECDGADYHRGADDAVRDQYLHSWGIVPVRASGTEIYTDPGRVAGKVSSAVIGLMGTDNGSPLA